MTRDAWIAKHPYLKSIADLQCLVDSTAEQQSIPEATAPIWDHYQEDFGAGVPLLHSSGTVDFISTGQALASIAKQLASIPLPKTLTEDCRVLNDELHRTVDSPRKAVGWLLDEGSFVTACPGLLQYLGWTVLTRHLSGVVSAFKAWRNEEHWLRSYCPLCGAPPNMAQLVNRDTGRVRFLSCGCCGTRWQYRRTGCPFCSIEDDHRLSVLAIDGERELRLDYCDSCLGYLKTYIGEGNEKVFLSDWTSLHLDFAAANRGLKRVAMSLYTLNLD